MTISALKVNADDFNAKEPSRLLLKYDFMRSASIVEERDQSLENVVKPRVYQLLGRQGGTFLASAKLKNLRKYIVCGNGGCMFFLEQKYFGLFGKNVRTIERTSYSGALSFERISDNSIFMPALDIRTYNKEIQKFYPGDKSKTLVFQTGHPQDGCTYVQHPYRQNEYIELSEFHWEMLHEKFIEMSNVFEMLGAKEATCKVIDMQASHEVNDEQLTARIEAACKKFGGGDIEGSYSERVGETFSRLQSLELSRKTQGHKPRRPNEKDFPFLRDSRELQSLVNNVCDGHAPEEEKFTLVYKDDYGVNAKTEASLEVEVKSGVVDGKVQGGWEMTSDLAVNKSLLWVYTVKFK